MKLRSIEIDEPTSGDWIDITEFADTMKFSFPRWRWKLTKNKVVLRKDTGAYIKVKKHSSYERMFAEAVNKLLELER